jgi:hypothetical protein
LIWDNASWHIISKGRYVAGSEDTTQRSKERLWNEDRHLCVAQEKSPWLNAIEPKWVHGKRKVVEPDGLLGTHELADRVCAAFGCPHYEHLLSVTENVA